MTRIAGKAVYTIIAVTLLASLLLTPGSRSTAHGQIALPPIQDPLRRPIDRGLDRVDRTGTRIQRRVDEAEDEVEETTDEVADEVAVDTEQASGTVVDEAGQTVQGVAGTAVNAADATVSAAQGVAGHVENLLRPFALDIDPSGWPIETNVVVMLLNEQELAAIMRTGVNVLSRREMPALGLTLLTARDASRPATAMRDELRQAHPGVAVDFNHVYRFASDLKPEAQSAADDALPDAVPASTDGTSLRVGMIDSAVKSDHPALRDSLIVSRDFAAHEGERPLGHGTAVASLIARSAAHEAEVYAASVFFQTPGFAPGATTESLVAALDWLAAQQVDAVNMSLAGPANTLLEKTLAGMTATGPTVVAAVGNNGPSGEPLYPAAYEGIIGVTAVDRKQKIFPYANRGDHVDFAALGVDLKVADSGGSWRVESGTSMASPHVTVVVARALHSGDLAREGLMEALTAHAEDLGKKGFDRIFGYGLIAEAPVLLSRH